MTASTCQPNRRALRPWLTRGALGLALLAVTVSTGERLVATSALLAALFAFRGCPMCWVFELIDRMGDNGAPRARKGAS